MRGSRAKPRECGPLTEATFRLPQAAGASAPSAPAFAADLGVGRGGPRACTLVNSVTRVIGSLHGFSATVRDDVLRWNRLATGADEFQNTVPLEHLRQPGDVGPASRTVASIRSRSSSASACQAGRHWATRRRCSLRVCCGFSSLDLLLEVLLLFLLDDRLLSLVLVVDLRNVACGGAERLGIGPLVLEAFDHQRQQSVQLWCDHAAR